MHTYFVGAGQWAVHNACDIRYGELEVVTHQGQEVRRATEAVAVLSPPLKAGTRAGVNPDGWVTGMNRGHLIGRQMGERGIRQNLVLLYPSANQATMFGVETQVVNAINAGETITYRVTPIYTGTNPVPDQIVIRAEGDKGFDKSWVIPNIP